MHISYGNSEMNMCLNTKEKYQILQTETQLSCHLILNFYSHSRAEKGGKISDYDRCFSHEAF